MEIAGKTVHVPDHEAKNQAPLGNENKTNKIME